MVEENISIRLETLEKMKEKAFRDESKGRQEERKKVNDYYFE